MSCYHELFLHIIVICYHELFLVLAIHVLHVIVFSTLFIMQAHATITRPRQLEECVFPVPANIQKLMCQPQSNVTFRFTNPTEAMVRLLACSPLAADAKNLALFPEDSDVLDDYCNGGRMKRIHNALPHGSAALTAVLFFDELNQDQKGYATSEGAILVGGFFRRVCRESTYAKTSLGAFPGLDFPKTSKDLTSVKHFMKELRNFQITAIRKCFSDFNAKGGAVVKLQDGTFIYFAKAVLLAIYCDHPAAVKCAFVGSSCPQCYTARSTMAHPGEDGVMEMRTNENMRERKRYYEAMIASSPGKDDREEARKRARLLGVRLQGLSNWNSSVRDDVENWIFGPDATLDNIYQNLPQVQYLSHAQTLYHHVVHL